LDFQNILKARKTTSRFATEPRDLTFWKEALDRAVVCGLTAPNHKRTEPFRFKRLLAPSESTQRLADIAFQVSLRHKTAEEAERKRHKWQKVPAFLVTLVEQGDDSIVELNESDLYQPLPYVPPATELALEDYAAACAAVQNVLLSLHAEGIASKWATGPIIQTPAFRHLVQARPHDRVVGIIMVGMPQVSSPIDQGPRRRRRRAMEEILQDL
jgi:nitroreductase